MSDSPIESTKGLHEPQTEIERMREAVRYAQRSFSVCDCRVCYSNLVLVKKQLARLEASND